MIKKQLFKEVGLLVAVILVFTTAFMAFTIETVSAASIIQIKHKTITLINGQSISQKLLTAKGKEIPAQKVKWKSARPSIAKISNKGKIKSIKAGKTTMTAKYKDKTYKFNVKVVDVKKI